jgi:hypothetical protein
MDGLRRAACLFGLVLSLFVLRAGAAGGLASIDTADLRTWLTYIASDELQGRATYSAGLGLAAAYIQEHLRKWGVQSPPDPPNAYLQTVRVVGVKRTSRSSVTIRIGSAVRTFADRQAVTFPQNAGRPRTFTVDRVEFSGYGLHLPAADQKDFSGRDVNGAVVVWLGADGPRNVDERQFRRALTTRGRYITDQLGAAAGISPSFRTAPAQPSADSGGSSTSTASSAPDFTTSARLDHAEAPVLTADETLLDFLFSRAPVPYRELQRRAEAREPLPSFRLDDVVMTFNVDVDYEVVRTQLTHNVVAMVRGSDPRLRDTYVAFGAHYDHVGYAEGGAAGGEGLRAPPGRVTPGAEADRIWNGADDDGSGTVALMALAKAFAEGPPPKRSLLFVWHAGEERGLLGSRYFVDHAPVPLDGIVAHLNVDMVGRNRDNKASEADTVYLVGSDRISSELHEINRQANRALPRPLTLNYELNDPSDVEQLYYRSDHYSYAVKGIPIIFFTTGLHPDYHANTDEVSKIEFDKLARVTQLVYETGWRLANLDHAPARDNRGPRAGRGTK